MKTNEKNEKQKRTGDKINRPRIEETPQIEEQTGRKLAEQQDRETNEKRR